MPDFLTLKLAIYFIGPAIALYVAAYVCGEILTFIAQMVVEHDVSHDMAVRIMASVLASTGGMAALVHLTTHALWATLTAGTAAFFFVGGFLYSRTIEDISRCDRDGSIAPIGLPRGFLISSIITLAGLIVTMLVLWART